MRETPKARQAYADYVALGPARSLAKLLALYQTRPEGGPTHQLSQLKQWSGAHHWQDQIDGIAAQAQAEAEAQQAAYVAEIMDTGFAQTHERIKALNKLGTWLEGELDNPDLRWLREKKSVIVGQEPVITTDNDGQERMIGSVTRYESFWVQRPNVGWVSKLLEALGDMAAETHGRIRRTEVTGRDGDPIEVKDDTPVEQRAALVAAIIAAARDRDA